MVREESALYALYIKWDSFIKKTVESFMRPFMVKGLGGKRERITTDAVYDKLTKLKFDTNGFDYVFKSQTHFAPVKRKTFFKNARKTKILKNITNEAAAKRISRQLRLKLGPIHSRMDRLGRYFKNTNPEAISKSIGDLKKIVNTGKTQVGKLTKEISHHNRALRRKSLTREQRQWLNKTIGSLKKERSLWNARQVGLNKRINSFVKNANYFSESKLTRQYKSLIKAINSDLVDNHQRAMTADVYRRSGSSWVTRVAETEFAKKATQKDIKELKARDKNLGRNQTLLVIYSLSSNHNIVDICDDWAQEDRGYGPGISKLEDARIPVDDTHPICKCRLVEYGILHSDGPIERF